MRSLGRRRTDPGANCLRPVSRPEAEHHRGDSIRRLTGREPARGHPGLAKSGFAVGVDRSHVAFRGFLPRKTTLRDLNETTVIAKPLLVHHRQALVKPRLRRPFRRTVQWGVQGPKPRAFFPSIGSARAVTGYAYRGTPQESSASAIPSKDENALKLLPNPVTLR